LPDCKQSEGTLACPRCKVPMKEVVWIAPVQSDPELIGYECPSCGCVTGVLISLKDREQARGELGCLDVGAQQEDFA
jgi:hypothetical protein